MTNSNWKKKTVGKKIRDYLYKSLPVLIILLLGLFFYFWFDYKDGLVVIGGDGMIPLSPADNLKFLYKWVGVDNGFEGNLSNSFLFPFFALMQKIGFGLTFSHFLYTYFIRVSGALGMYYLGNVIFKGRASQKKISLLAAVLYMFTPATFNMSFTYGLFGFLPLILALFIEGLRRENYIIYPLLIAVGYSLGSLPDPHPRSFIITSLVLFFYAIFEIVKNRNIKKVFLFSAASAAYVFLLNAWFFIPYLYNILIPNYVSSIATTVSIVRGAKFLDEGTANVNMMFRLFSNNLNFPSIQQSEYLTNKLVLINYIYPLLAFGSIFFIFSKKKGDARPRLSILFLCCFALTFLFFAKGTNPPSGSIYKWMLINIPLFRIFRTTAYLILGSAVAYSLLVSFTLVSIGDYIRKRWIRIAYFFIVLAFLAVDSYPLFIGYPTLNLGNIIQADNKHGVAIPDDYREINTFIDKDINLNKVVYLPLVNGYEELGFGYFGIAPMNFIINKPLIISAVNLSLNGQSPVAQNILYSDVIDSQKSSQALAGLFNARYVIINNDVAEAQTDFLDEKAARIFDQIGRFGKMSLYKVNNKYYLPHFYTANSSIVSKRDIDEISRILAQEDYDPRSVIYFTSQNPDNPDVLSDFQSRKGALPTLEYKMIDPTKYRVRVHGASAIFPLVFSESFHNGWQAYLTKTDNPRLKLQNLDEYRVFDGNDEGQASKGDLFNLIRNGEVSTLGDGEEKTIISNKWRDRKEKVDDVKRYKIGYVSKNIQGSVQNDNLSDGNFFETWSKKPLEKKYHLMVNGYANSWMIDSAALCGDNDLCSKKPDGSYDFELVIEFWPQKLFYVGLLISISTILASAVHMLYNYKKRKSGN